MKAAGIVTQQLWQVRRVSPSTAHLWRKYMYCGVTEQSSSQNGGFEGFRSLGFGVPMFGKIAARVRVGVCARV